MRKRFVLCVGGLCLWMIFIFAGCNRDNGQSLDQLPTPLTPDAYATGIVLTQNAPPPGFETVAFPTIDLRLNELAGWRYEVLLQFDGVFARTPRTATALNHAEVSYNQIASARRVVAEISGDLTENASTYEAVQLGPDIFVVQDGACVSNAGAGEETAVSLSAGSLIGGVNTGVPAGKKAVINGQQVWLYTFTLDDLNLPNIRLGDDGKILAMAGEIWVAPEINAVVRYYLNLEVENANILGSTLPVTGTVIIRYDLYDVGLVPNLSVPFGC